MAKLVLDTSAMMEDFFEDTAMIGIVTAQPAYRFCWILNNHFDINFIRDPEQNLSLQKKDKDKKSKDKKKREKKKQYPPNINISFPSTNMTCPIAATNMCFTN